MKNLKYLAVAVLLVMTACFQERDYSISHTWVSFETDVVDVLENYGDPVDIAIHYSGPLRNEAITVNYSVTENGAIEGADFTYPPLTGSVQIPAGETSVSLRAIESLIDNDVKDDERSVTFTIQSAGNLNVGFPGPDQLRKSVTIRIVDNDCDDDVAKISRWLGPLTAEDVGYGVNAVVGAASSAGLCGGVLLVSGDALGVGYTGVMAIEFSQDAPGSSTGIAKVKRDVFFDNPGLSHYEFEAEGEYDEETREITMDYLVYASGAPSFGGTLIIKP